jgi:hypothetical protein
MTLVIAAPASLLHVCRHKTQQTMDSKQEAKVSMYLKVQLFLQNHLAALTALFSIITTYKTKLDDFITDIFDADAIATADTTGYAEAKGAKRAEATTLSVRISGGGSAYYKDQGDSGKQNEIFFNESEFTRAKDTEVFTQAMQVWRLADPVGAALAPHGITTTDISNLQLKALQYLAIVQLPQGKRSEKVAQGKKVDALMAEVDDFFKETLDPQMRVLKGTANQELLDEYESNRLIDDNPTSGSQVVVEGDLASPGIAHIPDGVNIMKGYMESGEFSRGKEPIRADGGIVLVGNFDVDVEHQQRIGHLLGPLPDSADIGVLICSSFARASKNILELTFTSSSICAV